MGHDLLLLEDADKNDDRAVPSFVWVVFVDISKRPFPVRLDGGEESMRQQLVPKRQLPLIKQLIDKTPCCGQMSKRRFQVLRVQKTTVHTWVYLFQLWPGRDVPRHVALQNRFVPQMLQLTLASIHQISVEFEGHDRLRLKHRRGQIAHPEFGNAEQLQRHRKQSQVVCVRRLVALCCEAYGVAGVHERCQELRAADSCESLGRLNRQVRERDAVSVRTRLRVDELKNRTLVRGSVGVEFVLAPALRCLAALGDDDRLPPVGLEQKQFPAQTLAYVSSHDCVEVHSDWAGVPVRQHLVRASWNEDLAEADAAPPTPIASSPAAFLKRLHQGELLDAVHVGQDV